MLRRVAPLVPGFLIGRVPAPSFVGASCCSNPDASCDIDECVKGHYLNAAEYTISAVCS